MRILLITVIFAFTHISVAFSTEYICVFETMLTADVAEYSSNYQEALDVKSRSKFVFDITNESLIVNGEEYISVFNSSNNNGFNVYSNRDFPYVMFYFYPLDEKIIMVGMQESKNDTFLKSDSLSCYTSGSASARNLGGVIVPKPLNSPTNALSDRLNSGKLSERQQENIKQNDLLQQQEDNTPIPKPEIKTISMEEIIIPPPR